jgi:hypothetical protein
MVLASFGFLYALGFLYTAALETSWARDDLAFSGGGLVVGSLFATSAYVGHDRVQRCRAQFAIRP